MSLRTYITPSLAIQPSRPPFHFASCYARLLRAPASFVQPGNCNFCNMSKNGLFGL